MFSFSVVAGRAALSAATAIAIVAGTALAPASAAEGRVAHESGSVFASGTNVGGRAQTSVPNRNISGVSTANTSGYVKRVWTSGFQAELNRCRGAVDVSAVYHVRTIAERSDCGGRAFPTAPGAIVTLVGLDAGRYKVIGVVAHLNGRVNSASDIPRGYPLLFQTCARGYSDIRFVALAPLP
jgi:hypothetical protein